MSHETEKNIPNPVSLDSRTILEEMDSPFAASKEGAVILPPMPHGVKSGASTELTDYWPLSNAVIDSYFDPSAREERYARPSIIPGVPTPPGSDEKRIPDYVLETAYGPEAPRVAFAKDLIRWADAMAEQGHDIWVEVNAADQGRVVVEVYDDRPVSRPHLDNLPLAMNGNEDPDPADGHGIRGSTYEILSINPKEDDLDDETLQEAKEVQAENDEINRRFIYHDRVRVLDPDRTITPFLEQSDD